MNVPRRASPERVSAFSDGVFAVLITVLVLELRPPEHPTFVALLQLWPTWLSYAVSYLFIAIVWINHHYQLRFRGNDLAPAMVQLRALTFYVSTSILYGLDGGQQIGAATRGLLCQRVLPRKRDLYRADLGACKCGR